MELIDLCSKSSPERSELDRLEQDFPTTPEDVRALRRARERAGREFTLEQIHLLEPPDWLPPPGRRKTSEGWEPFEQ